MKTIDSLLGPVTINDARIVTASGHGQYKIEIDIIFEGKPNVIKVHSTDSELFDKAHGDENHNAIVLKEAEYTIEKAIEDYVNSL